MRVRTPEEHLRAYYKTLYCAWGPQHWWPAGTAFEVIAGAYLTQNTSWTNVELALKQLRRAGCLSLQGIREAPLAKLELFIRPAGYFRQKAARLKGFVAFVDERYGGSLQRMFAQPTTRLRDELLTLNGIGPETADSILLYAGQHPVFVVDAYTRRILGRHGILAASSHYEEVRELCERALSPVSGKPVPARSRLPRGAAIPVVAHRPSPVSRAPRSSLAQVYNDMHGLIVNVGKHYCFKSKPLCEQCPLREFLPQGSPKPKVE